MGCVLAWLGAQKTATIPPVSIAVDALVSKVLAEPDRDQRVIVALGRGAVIAHRRIRLPAWTDRGVAWAWVTGEVLSQRRAVPPCQSRDVWARDLADGAQACQG